MAIKEVLSELELSEALELFQPHWEESEASAPDGLPAFLEPAAIAESREYIGLDPGLDPLLIETARRVAGNPALFRLAWHMDRLFFEHRDYSRFQPWPLRVKGLDDGAGLLYLLIALTAVEPMRRRHAERGIPEEYTRGGFGHLDESMERYRFLTGGGVGLQPRSLNWLRNHLEGELIRFGRLEFMLRPFRCQVHVFRNRSTGDVVALAEEGLRFDAAGLRAAEGDAGAWESTFHSNGEGAEGYPISPFGKAIRRQIRLPGGEWREALKRGDVVMETHIPSGGGMTLDLCRDSIRRGTEFFPRYFPERPFSAVACTSWILGTHLQEMFPPTANLVRFQKEVYLLPLASAGRDGLYFIFAQDQVDPATAPRDTSLRRAFLEYMTAGKRLRSGGMFLMLDDFERFGEQPYQRHWPPAALREALTP